MKKLNIDKIMFIFAGSMILISLALAHFVHYNWLLLTMLVGINMIQAMFTGFCPMVILLKKLGFKTGVAFK